MRFLLVLTAAAAAGSMAAETGRPIAPIVLRPTAAPAGQADGWHHLVFKSRPPTRYEMVGLGGTPVLRATAVQSASMLYTRVEVDSLPGTVLHWRWRVDRSTRGADLRGTVINDASARIYVGFRYAPELVPATQRIIYWLLKLKSGAYPPAYGIAYLWAGETPTGTARIHPDYSRLQEIVVRSGEDALGVWHEEERDVAADFEAAFGFPAPPISHIGLMTDSDDTSGSALAWFGEMTIVPGDGPGAAAPARADRGE